MINNLAQKQAFMINNLAQRQAFRINDLAHKVVLLSTRASQRKAGRESRELIDEVSGYWIFQDKGRKDVCRPKFHHYSTSFSSRCQSK
jgi:hypothetical protein